MKIFKYVLITICLLPIMNSIGVADTSSGLVSAKFAERRAAYKTIVAYADSDSVSVREVIGNLRAILNRINIRERKMEEYGYSGTLHLIIEALGELKAKESIPDLLPYFTFLPGGYEIKSITEQHYYPVPLAFLKMGETVIPYMKDMLVMPNATDEAKRLAAWVIMKILGKDRAVEEIQQLEQANPFCRLESGDKLSDYIRNFIVTYHTPDYKTHNDSYDKLNPIPKVKPTKGIAVPKKNE